MKKIETAFRDGRWVDVLRLANKALAIDPHALPAHLYRVTALSRLKRTEEAFDCISHLLGLNPENPALAAALGDLYIELENFHKAIKAYELAISLGGASLGVQKNLLGCYIKTENYDRARELGRDLLDLYPHDFHLVNSMALIEIETDNPEKGLELANQAITNSKNDFPEARLNRVKALTDLARYQEGLTEINGLINDYPRMAEAKTAQASLLACLGNTDEAISLLRSQVKLLGRRQDRMNLSTYLLRTGHFSEGWQLNRARFEGLASNDRRSVNLSFPEWSPNVNDSSTLVWSEQGIGDEILYMSCINDFKVQAGTVFCSVDPRLVQLFQRSFPDVHFLSVAEECSIEFSSQIPLASIPMWVRKSIHDFPKAEGGYLKADSSREQHLRGLVTREHRPVYGVSWRSNRRDLGKHKSIPLEKFLIDVQKRGGAVCNLQYGQGQDEFMALSTKLGLPVFDPKIDLTNDIDGIGTLSKCLAGVLSASNSVAHIAAAYGAKVEVWLKSGRGIFYYWHPELDSCPWYPGIVRKITVN